MRPSDTKILRTTMTLILNLVLCCSKFALAASITWHQTIDESFSNNAEIQAAEQTLRSAEQNWRSQHNGYFPQLSANVGFTHGNSVSLTPSASTTSPNAVAPAYDPTANGEPQDNYVASVNASQNVFAGLLDYGKISASLGTLQEKRAILREKKSSVSKDLVTAYANLLLSQRSIELQKSIIRRREENLRLVELNFQTGRENKGSALLSKANLNQAEFEEHQAENYLRSSSADLKRVLSRDLDDDLNVSEDVPIETPAQQMKYEQFVPSNTDVLKASAAVQNAEGKFLIARSNFYPALNLSASFGRQGSRFWNEKEEWILGFNVTIPIFNGGKDLFATLAARADVHSAERTKENTERLTLQKLKFNHTGLLEAIEKLKVDESFVSAATVRANVARKKYNNGLISFEDWDIIENDLINRQKNVLVSQRDRAVAYGNWLQAQGKGFFKDE